MDLPNEDALRWIVARYAALRAAHGEAIGEPELLEPSGRHFPDEFTGDADSVRTLFERMLTYVPVSDEVEFEIAQLAEEGASGGGGCSSGACGGGAEAGPVRRGGAIDTGEKYVVALARSELASPSLLAASLARSAGGVVLFEAEEEVPDVERGALSEIAAVMNGFGVVLLNGASVYAKGCGGLREHRATVLPVAELSVALALFLGVHGKKPSAARAHLDTTQREAFDEAVRWMESNAALVTKLKDTPEALADGVFTIAPVRGLLGRIFAKKKAKDDELPEFTPQKPARSRTPEELARLAEAKRLVDEALGS